MTKATLVVALTTTLLAGSTGIAQAQGQPAPETTIFLTLEIGAQPQQRTIDTTSSFPLYDETATLTSSQPIHNGPMFAVSAGQRLSPHFGVAVGLSLFKARESDSTVVASIPDLAFFSRPKVVTQTATGLKHSEAGLHLQAVWFHPVGEKLEIVLSAGPSVFYVKQDLIVVTVTPGTQNITATQDNQAHGALGFNGGFEGNYFFNARYGAGIFVRYAGGSVDLPAVQNLRIGGIQGGLGLRVRF